MPLEDPRGVVISDTSAEALDHYEAALDDVLSFHGDPIGAADAALERDPDLVSAALLKAHVLAFSLHPGFMKKAASSLTAATELSMNPREQLHAAAITAWLDGDIAQSRASFGLILESWPRDLLALMFTHQADFFGADETALLHRPTNALAGWPDDLAGRGYVLAMRAFGLEEAGRFAEAEAAAREALAANPRDAWALHAVAHVLEMQGRDTEGIAWYAERRADWAEDCFFAVHNWWHWALYHVDRDEPASALALYDEGLAPGPRAITLNLCDAASLLWRLQLAGHPVGERFAALAFVGAGRLDRAAAHLTMLEASTGGGGPHAHMLCRLGVPVSRALLAFGRGQWAEAARKLEKAMPDEQLMTGSRAQRDVLVMTLIEATLRAGERHSALRLLQPRATAKPASARTERDLVRCG